MHRKALALFSGGLDSLLAVKVIQDQGVEVLAITFVSPFFGGTDGSEARSSAGRFGIPHMVVTLGSDFLDLIKNPLHGYGSAINPCVDCKADLLRRARLLMPELGADFVITGEVLGQRPMSQRLDTLLRIQRECGLGELLVRPLSARLLPLTLPVREGWIDAAKLPAIKGRSRKDQIELAVRLGIDEYPAPAGGCLLTETSFAPKVRDLFEHNGELIPRDFYLLQTGRHFRLSPACKMIIGRDESDNCVLENIRNPDEPMLRWPDGMGPFAFIQGQPEIESIRMAARLLLRYTKAEKGAECRVAVERNGVTEMVRVVNDLEETDGAALRL